MSDSTQVQTVNLTVEQLDAIVQRAVTVALASVPGTRKAQPLDDAAQAKLDEKSRKRNEYIQRKKDTAIKLMKERGLHFNVFEKGRKLLIFSDLTFDKARRDGRPESLGKRIWSTANEYSLSGEPMVGGATS